MTHRVGSTDGRKLDLQTVGMIESVSSPIQSRPEQAMYEGFTVKKTWINEVGASCSQSKSVFLAEP